MQALSDCRVQKVEATCLRCKITKKKERNFIYRQRNKHFIVCTSLIFIHSTESNIFPSHKDLGCTLSYGWSSCEISVTTACQQNWLMFGQWQNLSLSSIAPYVFVIWTFDTFRDGKICKALVVTVVFAQEHTTCHNIRQFVHNERDTLSYVGKVLKLPGIQFL